MLKDRYTDKNGKYIVIILMLLIIFLCFIMFKYNENSKISKISKSSKDNIDNTTYAENVKNITNVTQGSLIYDIWIKGESVEEYFNSSTESYKENEVVIKNVTKQAIKNELSQNRKDVDKAIRLTSEMIGLDTRYAKALIHTESNFNPKAINYNFNSSDHGLCQLNTKGEPVYLFVGKEILLADERTIIVNHNNYKKDMYINLYMGLKSYQKFLNMSDFNPYIAYACYNAGSNVVKMFSEYDMKKLTLDEVCEILDNSGYYAYKHASLNIRYNFYEKYKFYFKK